MESFFYLADDIQELAGGKLLLVGLYADRIVYIGLPPSGEKPTSEKPFGIPNLALMLNLRELKPGDHAIGMRILLPDGTPMTDELAPRQSTVLASGAHNVIVKLSPFPVKQFGRYTLSVQVDDEVVTAAFFLRMAELDALAQAKTTTPIA